MPVEVILPKVDMDMVSGSIEAWRVGEGDVVKHGQLIFEIGTNKAVMEVDAPASGIIRRISAQVGEIVPVGAVVAWIYGPDESNLNSAPATQEMAPTPLEKTGVSNPSVNVPATSNSTTRATPLARRVAKQLGIDIAKVRGSGPRGRICEAHVLAISTSTSKQSTTFRQEPDRGGSGSPKPNRNLDGELVPFSAVRRIVARRLTESAATIPHFHLQATMDMTSAQLLLAKVSPSIVTRTHAKPSLTVLLVHALGQVLARHPLLNASVEGEGMRLHTSRHIGVAMDRDGDLLVPVMRHAGVGTLAEAATEFARLRKAVQDKTLKPADMEGGTFTLSNLGMFGIDNFTAIINPPQTGILAVGRTVEVPVARNGAVVIRPQATFCLSADHRLVNGVQAAKFMADLRQVIETPELLI